MPSIWKRFRAFLFGRQDAVRPMARIDAAGTDAEMRELYSRADSLGPNAAYDVGTRQRLRDRGRHEAVNNSFARGLVRTLANDLIGSVPRLQLTIPGYAQSAKAIERRYTAWARSIKLGRKLRLLEKGAARDGEGFGILFDNPMLAGPVRLDIRLVEPEQCATPPSMAGNKLVQHGVELDAYGNVVAYHFLKDHPGESLSTALGWSDSDFVRIPAHLVIHWFEHDRAGQTRGIPRITSALPLFGQRRRFSLATLTAAEFAASVAGVLKTSLPPDTTDVSTVDAWKSYEAIRGALMTLPAGYEATQLKSEHPNATFSDFNREILNECGRGVGAPLNVVSGNSSGYNYSSGRLDHVPYQAGIGIERHDLQADILDPVFAAWLLEATLTGVIADADLPPVDEWTTAWHFDGFASIDPNKDAQADDIRLKDGTTTYAEIYSAYGQDWESHFEQMAAEKAKCESLGLPWPLHSQTPTQPTPDPADPMEDPADDPADDGEEPPTAMRRIPIIANGNGYHGGRG